MPTPEGVLVRSVLSEKEIFPAISFSRLIEARAIRPRPAGFLATIGRDETTPRKLSSMIGSVFGMRIPLNNIPFDRSPIDERDDYFAQDFGYVAKNFVSARHVEKDGESSIEAWVGPALIQKDHPLANQEEGVFIIPGSGFPSEAPNALTPLGDIFSAHYVRFTVEDHPGVLAQLAQVIGDNEINIAELRQPERNRRLPPKDSFRWYIMSEQEREEAQTEEKIEKPSEVAFLLDPCEESRVRNALASIGSLDACLKINSVFRLVGHPTNDLGRAYSKSE